MHPYLSAEDAERVADAVAYPGSAGSQPVWAAAE
jgi:hypothetical protein